MFRQFALFAEVTPLTTSAKVVGGLVAAATLAASVYLILRSRSVAPAVLPEDHRPENFNDWTRSRPWRLPVALLVLLIGVLFAVGIFVDPKEEPRLFVRIWSAVIVLIFIVVPFAIFDALVVRARGQIERVRLLEESRAALQNELRDRQRNRFRKVVVQNDEGESSSQNHLAD